MPDLLVSLPDEIVLDLSEVAVVLGALDRGAALAGTDGDDAVAIRRAVKLVTAKLWPELGGLLDDEG